MEAVLFYRNLYTLTHRQRWNERYYTSNNQPHGPPNAWTAAALANQPEADYPLTTAGVVFLQTAREKFVAFVNAFKDAPGNVLNAGNLLAAFNNQPVEVQEEQLEIAGVSAYTTPGSAYWHGQQAAEPPDELVAFYGFKVCDLAPEQDQGGVIAAVVKSVCVLDPQAFINRYCDGAVPPNPHPQPEEGPGLVWDDVVEGQ
ncbi:MAG: hypothetical protein J0I06_12270 [Planctomycetes bacterium]|nr:hypothetical protein [Planctomycetota bacterium]